MKSRSSPRRLDRHVHSTLYIHFVLIMGCSGKKRQNRHHEKYKDNGKYSDGVVSRFEIVQIRSDKESINEESLPCLILKRKIDRAGTLIDQNTQKAESEFDKQLMTDDIVSQERRGLVMPLKKRRYVEQPEDGNSVTSICTAEETQDVKPSVAFEKRHKSAALSADESDGKEKRGDKKKHQQAEAELPEPTKGAPWNPTMLAPDQDRACAGTSHGGFVPFDKTKYKSQNEFWVAQLKQQFNELDCTKILRDVEFTEEQSEILHQSFRALARRMICIRANSTRFKKTHACKICRFSISHLCMSLDYIRRIPFGTEFTNQATMMPSQTVVCKCGFAFCHGHLKRTRTPVVPPDGVGRTPHLPEYNRSVDVSCSECHTNVIMTNQSTDVCHDLTTWDSNTDVHRKKFYTNVQNSRHYPETDSLSLDQFYACSKGCCLMFHRCPKKVEELGVASTTPD